MAQHGLVGDMKAPVDVTYLADTVILLRYFEALGRVQRAVSVIKKRTGWHEDTDPRVPHRQSRGLPLGEPLADFQGVLERRAATYVGKTGVTPKRERELKRRREVESFPRATARKKRSSSPLTGAVRSAAASAARATGILAGACLDRGGDDPHAGTGRTLVVTLGGSDALTTRPGRRSSSGSTASRAWSDLPFIVLTQKGGGPETNPSAARLAETRWPTSPSSSAPSTRPPSPRWRARATKARLRQYEARDRLEELRESQERLATAMLAGKLGAWSIDIETETLSPRRSAPDHGLAGRATVSAPYPGLLALMIHPDDIGPMQTAVGCSHRHRRRRLHRHHRIMWPYHFERWKVQEVNGRTLRDDRGRCAASPARHGRHRPQEGRDPLRQFKEWLERG